MNRTIDNSTHLNNQSLFPYTQTSMLSNFTRGKDPTNIGYMCMKMKEKFIS